MLRDILIEVSVKKTPNVETLRRDKQTDCSDIEVRLDKLNVDVDENNNVSITILLITLVLLY